jgi:hypothetical protein
MKSSELRKVIGDFNKQLLESAISKSDFVSSLQSIDLESIEDDDGNLINLKAFVAKLITKNQQ